MRLSLHERTKEEKQNRRFFKRDKKPKPKRDKKPKPKRDKKPKPKRDKNPKPKGK
jgi:hypothetical protein